jgi:biotin operon repressor
MSHPYLRRITAADQTATHLRDGIREGRWKHQLPGTRKLAEELKISRFTVNEAVAKLLDEGVLVRAGDRRPHRVASAPGSSAPKSRVLRTALLLPDALDKFDPDSRRWIMEVISNVRSFGHECVSVTLPVSKGAGKTGRLARLVRDTEADAWLVYNGTREVLQWFCTNEGPVLALGGNCRELPLALVAASDMAVVGREAFRRLAGLGHRRMVFIGRQSLRIPEPRLIIRTFHEELQAIGVKPGEYNVPDWDETPEGLEALLKSLFRVTPPSALICETSQITSGVLGFLAKSGIRVPGDVSVVSMSTDGNPVDWVFPGVRLAHAEMAESPFFRRIRDWVTNVARGRADTRRFICPAHLNEGNTIGTSKEP